MAERRMFAKSVIDSDLFLSMPMSSQLLYFHLGMKADDDGFINNPKMIQRMIGCNEDDMKVLITKGYIIPFESGIILVTHWRIHNFIRADRYKPSIFYEKQLVVLGEDNTYRPLLEQPNLGIPSDNQRYTQYSKELELELAKDKLDKNKLSKSEWLVGIPDLSTNNQQDFNNSFNNQQSINTVFNKRGIYGNVSLTDDQYKALVSEYGETIIKDYISRVDEYSQIHKKRYGDCFLTIKKWIKQDQAKSRVNNDGFDLIETEKYEKNF